MKQRKALAGYIIAMLIFGTIGIFRRYISFSSGIIAMMRGLLGSLFLFAMSKMQKREIDSEGLHKNIVLLILSGIAMGFNWIFLFESYRYTTVAIATLCYYMQPVILILASPFVLGEKLNPKKILPAAAAVSGMILVTGVSGGNMPADHSLKGIAFGLIAAVLYAIVVFINMKITSVNSSDKTMMQLLIAGACMIPYLLLTDGFINMHADARSLLLLLIVCFVHTGFAYALYFHAMEDLPSSTVALLGYIDPVTAVILSALFLKEPMTAVQALGAVLIIAAALVNEAIH